MSRINIQEGDKDKVKTTDAKKFIRKFSTMSMVDGGNMTIMDPKLGKKTKSILHMDIHTQRLPSPLCMGRALGNQ